MKWEMAMALLMLPGLILGITVHEFAHAWSASLLGDDFARRQKRVSLNPLRHLTPLGTLAILFLPIGWGKPVQVNIYNFKRPRRDFLLTSLAGPLANLLLAAVFLGLMQLTKHPFFFRGWVQTAAIHLHLFLTMGVLINVALATLNLLPIPPLDGSKIWHCLLPFAKPGFTPRANMFFMVVFVLLICSHTLQPVIDYAIDGVMRVAPMSDAVRLVEVIQDGKDALKQQDWQKAETLFSQGLAINPQSADCYYGRSYALLEQSKTPDALKDINQAIGIRPYDAHYYQLRARVDIAQGRLDEAKKDQVLSNMLEQNQKVLSQEPE
jgi:Zn-dependent protease